jgi:hypothetical protein
MIFAGGEENHRDGTQISPGTPDLAVRSAAVRHPTYEEVTMTTSNAEHATEPPERGSVSIDELARRKGVRPIESPADLAQDDVFETDEELDAFLAHVRATRHSDLA